MPKIPSTLKLHRRSRLLEIGYSDGVTHSLPCEYLRVFSPSAEVRGHGGQEPLLIGGKHEVNITAIEPIGRYAVRLRFTDGHDTGLYSWDVFSELAENQSAWWARYLARLAEHGMSRHSETTKLSALGMKSSSRAGAKMFMPPRTTIEPGKP